MPSKAKNEHHCGRTIIFYSQRQLIMSRKQKIEVTERLTNLSPDKYGKGAFCQLTFTPSKLADNVLFREASNLKRIEQETCKGREYEAHSHILVDQVTYLKKQRDAISESLTQIIDMYKKIIAEMENKNDERLKDIQRRFKEEIHRYISDKEEEAKYFQSEQELLEERIHQLQNQVQSLKDELAATHSNKSDSEKLLDQTRIEFKYLQEKQAATEEKAKADDERAKQQFENLKKDFMNAEVNWKNQLNQEINKKNKEIEGVERTHRAEFQKLETQRNTQNLMKNQQINEITKTFDFESKRLNEIIGTKDRMIDHLSLQNNKEKTRILSLTRDYESQINHLTHEKNRLFDELQILSRQNEKLAKEKIYITGELQSENINLRELLIQSSDELEKCKNQFMNLAKQNSHLVARLRSAEEEAKTWRDNYYLNKTRAY